MCNVSTAQFENPFAIRALEYSETIVVKTVFRFSCYNTQIGVKVDKKKELKINVGGGSIILILLIFALSIFSVLSIRASANEFRLASKTADSVSEYYSADTKATELLARICNLGTFLQEDIETYLSDVEEVTSVMEAEDGGTIVEYQVSINEKATLGVSVHLLLDGTHNILKWKMSQEDDGEYEFGIEMENLWDGTIQE